MICTAIESLWYYVSPEQIKSSQLSQLVSHATQCSLWLQAPKGSTKCIEGGRIELEP